MSTYNTTGTPAGTTATGGRRFGRKKASSPGTLMKNEAQKPGMKLTDWRSKSSERWGVARARVQERFSRLGASMSYGAFSCTHSLHPIRRKAVKEAEVQKKPLAKDRREQQEAAVHSNAAGRRVRNCPWRVASLNQGVSSSLFNQS